MRYIDADELYRETEKKIKANHECRMAVVDDEFLDLINDAFTEDVVPRSEVNNMLVGEANSLRVKFLIAEQEARGKALVAEHDRQLAREIFAVVENAWSTTYYESEFEERLSELKKKYTEGE